MVEKNNIKIKFTIPPSSSTTAHDIRVIGKYLPSGNNIYKNCQFFLNEDIENPDYWVVVDGVEKEESVTIDPNNLIFATAEVLLFAHYLSDSSDKFLNQFHKILTSHNIYRDNVEQSLPLQPWMIDAEYGKPLFRDSDLDHKFLSSSHPPKTKTMSIFCSSKGRLESDHDNHRIRYHFVMKLKDRFKDKLDIFGDGINSCNPKWLGLADYKYSIAIENQSRYNMITEKLYDCFLAECYPIYYGAPNVDEYFDKDSLMQINVADFKGSVREIEQAIEGNLWEKNYQKVLESKDLALNKYNWLMRIGEICILDHAQSKSNKKELVTIKPQSFFAESEFGVKNTKKKRPKLKKILRKIYDRF